MAVHWKIFVKITNRESITNQSQKRGLWPCEGRSKNAKVLLLRAPEIPKNWVGLCRCTRLWFQRETSIACYTLFANMTNRGTKLFFHWIKYCWRKQDERVAVHCSLFAVNFSAADDFFSTKKYFVFVEETTTPTQILRAVYGEKPVRKTWRTPFIAYSPYVVFSSFCPYFAVVRE